MLAIVIGAATTVAVGGAAFAAIASTSPSTATAAPASRIGNAADPAAVAVPTTLTTPAAPVTPPVRVVAPDERITDRLGDTIWLTADGRHVVTVPLAPGEPGPAQEQAKRVLDDNFAPDSINARVLGGRQGALYTGAYRGSDTLAKVTVQVDGEVLDAQVITLAGTPGWAVYYVDGPAPRPDPDTRKGPTPMMITAYAADGRVLAALAPPAAPKK
ncbi:hypothetical protein [Embleya sp. MST-111070]|uniref:hypothetical protein n=1 Tax=Embleya sp. MST-111070 TaxID=3398231 RepID=UPI003F7338F6